MFFLFCFVDIIKCADRALQALRGMKSGLEGTHTQPRSGRSRKHVKNEVSELFRKNAKKAKVCEWKHSFICLSMVGEPKVPTSSIDKDDLLAAGLGEKIIEFPSLNATAEEFRDIL